MKIFSSVALLVLIVFLSVSIAHAQSSYVLPYPSFMPGNIFYKIHRASEIILKYWYFGNFGQFEYNLKESDKYLVEAKTLFEYKQYLLGYTALQKSDGYFKVAPSYLLAAKTAGENISEKRKILQEASEKHIEYLETMQQICPDIFVWSPEKNPSSTLYLHQALVSAKQLRTLWL